MVRTVEDFGRFCSLLILDNGRSMVLEAFQRIILADFFAGRRESIACLPKGSGKTTLLAALALFMLLTDAQCDGAVCAASRDQAGLLLAQLRGFVERSPGLASRVRILQRQAVNRRTGGRFRVLAADVDTMDGLLLTFGIADELHRWRDSERYSILLAGVQKRDGRLFGISTSGIKEEGLLWAMRQRALELGAVRDGAYLSLSTESFGWHEWSLAEGTEYRDVAQVKAANPAPWVTEALLRERFESPAMTDVDWRRFSCNMWVNRHEAEAVIDIARWLRLADGESQPVGPACLSIDATMDRTSAAIGVAVFLDDAGELPLVDVAEHGSGIAWALESAVALSERLDNVGVMVDPVGPASSLIPGLEEFGVKVLPVTARSLAQASTGFYDAVNESAIRHRASAPLNQAVQGAVKRSLSQSWAFDRKKSISDPSPLLAAVLALHGLRTFGPISEAAYEHQFGASA